LNFFFLLLTKDNFPYAQIGKKKIQITSFSPQPSSLGFKKKKKKKKKKKIKK